MNGAAPLARPEPTCGAGPVAVGGPGQAVVANAIAMETHRVRRSHRASGMSQTRRRVGRWRKRRALARRPGRTRARTSGARTSAETANRSGSTWAPPVRRDAGRGTASACDRDSRSGRALFGGPLSWRCSRRAGAAARAPSSRGHCPRSTPSRRTSPFRSRAGPRTALPRTRPCASSVDNGFHATIGLSSPSKRPPRGPRLRGMSSTCEADWPIGTTRA
jgi:hypothetical protein